MSEKLWYLKNCNLFEQVSEEELRHVELSSKAKTFPRNGPIYLPADGANYVLLLASGRAKICNLTAVGKQSIQPSSNRVSYSANWPWSILGSATNTRKPLNSRRL